MKKICKILWEQWPFKNSGYFFFRLRDQVHIFMPLPSKKLERHFAFGTFVSSSFRSFVTHSDVQHNFRSVHAAVLKFLIWIPMKK